MQIHMDAREWAHWTLSGDVPDGPVQVSLDDGTTWHPTVRDGDVVRLLVGGPDAEPVEGMVRLVAGSHRSWLRLTEHPAVMIRRSNRLYVQP